MAFTSILELSLGQREKLEVFIIPQLVLGQSDELVGGSERFHVDPSQPIHGESIGQFLIGRRIGKGFEASVYECKPNVSNQHLKDDEARSMAMRFETTIVSAQHLKQELRKLKRVKDCCKAFRGRPFVKTISMVGIHVDGGDMHSLQVRTLMPQYKCNLFSLAEVHAPLEEATVRSIISQLIEAVDIMHDQGYSHGDLSGGNVFIDFDSEFPVENVRVHVGDFGFARPCTQEDSVGTNRLGTLPYRSPEALLRCQEIDPKKCDMWAVGINMFHLMTRRLHQADPNKSALEQELLQLHTYFSNFLIAFNAAEMSVFKPHKDISEYLSKSKFPPRASMTWEAICPQPNAYSVEAFELLSGLLQPNPDKRLSAKEALQHPIVRPFIKPTSPITKSSE